PAMIGDTSDTVTHVWAPLVAMLAGFVSFASPCVLPLVPGYLSFVTGEAVTDEGRGRWHRLAPILLFVAGFTVMFTLYGAFASTFVHLVKDRRGQIVAGVVIVVLGVLLIGYALGRGSIRLYAERRPFLERVHPGTAGALPLGMAFAAGWTPCVGPVLGAILGLAAVGSSRWGAFLLLCYSIGLGIPFIALGLGVEWLTGSARWVQRHYRAIAVVSGSLLVVVGVLVATGEFTRRLAPLIKYGPLL
ncbi:MAG TPA: cytochrome c biogenesis protein CcdA, partial [Actinomycetota bacterium]|nr:cytochrome c biogenesis protein CcdA [Actinomycetota bacterium]